MKDAKGCRLGCGKSWMGQPEESALQECHLTEIEQNKEWEMYQNWFRHLLLCETLMPKTWGRHCREWPAGKMESEIKLIQENSKSQISHRRQSWWDATAKEGASTIRQDSATYWAVQAGLLTPLTFVWRRLSPLAAFTSSAYFLRNGRQWHWQWVCEFYTANLTDIFGGL